jgi:hypothetical protein
MAEQHVRDRQKQYADRVRQLSGSDSSEGNQPKLASTRSERQIAVEASQKFYPGLSDRSERLRKKWRAQRDFWLEMVQWQDDVLETVETQDLAKIWIALAEANVPVVPNWPDGRPMSEEQMLRTEFKELQKLVELRRKDANRA